MPVAALTLCALLSAAPAADQDSLPFEDAGPHPHLAYGPVALGDTVLSADGGWLKSGLEGDIGIGFGVDLVLRVDSFLFHNGLSGQDGVHGGLRYTPLDEGTFRVAVAANAGEIFIGAGFNASDLFELGGDVTGAISFAEYGSLYARAGMRALNFQSLDGTGWGRDGEVGLGYEVPWRRFVFGAETFAWIRPVHDTIWQWRLRAGIAL